MRASSAAMVVQGWSGGVGGLTVSHELAERGFAVTVIEPKAFGGKARSIPVLGTGTAGRADLPGEHGFRFFPGFYKNIPDTMRRIPVVGNAEGVFTNLVDASQELLLFNGNQRFYSPPTESTLLQDYQGPIQAMQTIVTAIGIGAQVPPNEIEYFTRKLEVFFTSCNDRRVGEWEYVPWWDFVNAAAFSPEYQRVFGAGLTKDLVAAKGTVASTRAIGLMAEASWRAPTKRAAKPPTPSSPNQDPAPAPRVSPRFGGQPNSTRCSRWTRLATGEASRICSIHCQSADFDRATTPVGERGRWQPRIRADRL